MMSLKTHAGKRAAKVTPARTAFAAPTRPFDPGIAISGLANSGAVLGRGGPPGHRLAHAHEGRPLPDAVRTKMQNAFRRDFSTVRIHEDDHPTAIEAEAYTQGHHIHFARGSYQPGSLVGQQLIGHELAHVVQQQAGRVRGRGIQEQPHLEAEADRIGTQAAQSPPATAAATLPGRPSASAAGAIQPKRKQKFKGIKMSLHEFHGLGRELQPHRGQDAPGENLENLRILGHAPAAGLHDEDPRVTDIQHALGDLKQQRRLEKEQVTQTLRAADKDQFGAQLEKYTGNLQQANLHVTSARLQQQLGAEYEFRPSRGNLQTHIYHRDEQEKPTHVYTLHSGPSAFVSAGRFPTGRQRYVKRGSGKEYVADDFGVPTRRYAYAVKSKFQLDKLANEGVVTGRYSAKWNQNILKPTVGEKAALGYSTPAHERSGLDPLPKAPKHLSPGQMMYFHQEFGSGDRQRGVSATSTDKPLLSNEGSGFAENEGAMKLKIDTARLRRMRAGRPPEFANLHHQIPGLKRAVQAPALYFQKNPKNPDTVRTDTKKGIQYDVQKNQKHFDWSVGKNRELFIKSIRPRHVTARLDPTADERFVSPTSKRKQNVSIIPEAEEKEEEKEGKP